MPSFVIHDEQTNSFSLLATEDLSQVQTFSVFISAELRQPKDNSESPQYEVLEANIEFEIIVSNPCLKSSLESFIIEDMAISILGVPAT